MLSDKDKILRVAFYRIFAQGVEGTAEVLAQTVYDLFDKDGILTVMQGRLKGVISDGENKMYGAKVKRTLNVLYSSCRNEFIRFLFRVDLL